jgi:7,8-dihydroneopterin aldolase/epimerase/oxygenase
MNLGDQIEIRRLAVKTHIGVPEEERANYQTLWITVRMWPSQGFQGLNDDVANTVDYYEVSQRLSELAAKKPRQLIETLATEIAEFLLSCYPLSCVEVEVEKRILSNADSVSVKISRRRT